MEMRSRSRRLKTLYLLLQTSLPRLAGSSGSSVFVARLSRPERMRSVRGECLDDGTPKILARDSSPEKPGSGQVTRATAKSWPLEARLIHVLYFFTPGGAPAPGKIFSTSSCGPGITCTETSS